MTTTQSQIDPQQDLVKAQEQLAMAQDAMLSAKERAESQRLERQQEYLDARTRIAVALFDENQETWLERKKTMDAAMEKITDAIESDPVYAAIYEYKRLEQRPALLRELADRTQGQRTYVASGNSDLGDRLTQVPDLLSKALGNIRYSNLKDVIEDLHERAQVESGFDKFGNPIGPTE